MPSRTLVVAAAYAASELPQDLSNSDLLPHNAKIEVAAKPFWSALYQSASHWLMWINGVTQAILYSEIAKCKGCAIACN